MQHLYKNEQNDNKGAQRIRKNVNEANAMYNTI